MKKHSKTSIRLACTAVAVMVAAVLLHPSAENDGAPAEMNAAAEAMDVLCGPLLKEHFPDGFEVLASTAPVPADDPFAEHDERRILTMRLEAAREAAEKDGYADTTLLHSLRTRLDALGGEESSAPATILVRQVFLRASDGVIYTAVQSASEDLETSSLVGLVRTNEETIRENGLNTR